MFDKIIIKAEIDTNDIDTIVLKNYLEECSEGDEVFYKSTAYANFDGCFIEIRGNRLKCKCSICKLWSKKRTGKLDNSRPMTFAMSIKTIKELLMRLSVKPENAIVTYYEIGLTMKMKYPADTYIKEVSEIADRTLWNDANFPEAKQKTTEKSKYFRKVLKIYDKTYEAGQKGRNVGSNILRIETVYKHQSVPMLELMDNLFLNKIGRIFYADWSELKFFRELKATKGVKMSQLEKAREIHRIGVKKYKAKYKAKYSSGALTKKQWETMRSFANGWNIEKERYIEDIGEFEKEFRDKILTGYQSGRFTPFSKKQ